MTSDHKPQSDQAAGLGDTSKARKGVDLINQQLLGAGETSSDTLQLADQAAGPGDSNKVRKGVDLINQQLPGAGETNSDTLQLTDQAAGPGDSNKARKGVDLINQGLQDTDKTNSDALQLADQAVAPGDSNKARLDGNDSALNDWRVKNPERCSDLDELEQIAREYSDTPLGKAVNELFEEGAKNPEWFTKGSDAVKWLKSDPQRFAELAFDPDHSGIFYKGIREAEVGLGLERIGGEMGLLGPIKRDMIKGAGDLLDSTGQSWDIKAFNSSQPGRFKLNQAVGKIDAELARGQNVILDTADLGPNELTALRNAFKPNWQGRVKFYPPVE